MNPTQITAESNSKLSSALEHFKGELGKIRTGRAHPGMLDGVQVEVYGQNMPLKAVGSIAVPEPQLLQITPFDPSNLGAISDAIRNDQALDLNPADDGRVIRIQIPALTTESRTAIVKILGQKVEDVMIASRNIRHDALHKLEEAEKAKTISKDELTRGQKQLDEQIAKFKSQVEELSGAKERDIMTV